MKSLFEEVGMAAIVCICVLIVLSSFVDIFSNDMMRDKGIDFESGAEIYDAKDVTENYQDEVVTFENNIKFKVNPVTIEYNNGGDPFDWSDYIIFDETETNPNGNMCYAEFNGQKFDLTEFVIPQAYMGADPGDIDAISSKLINVRKTGTQIIPLLLRWEGISVEKNMYVTVGENPVKYTIRGSINSYGSDFGIRKDQSLILQADGNEYAYSMTDDTGYFEFTNLNEEGFTIKARVVSMDGEGSFSETTYAYNIPKSYFDTALETGSSVIDLGNVALSKVNNVYINSINYLVPIGMTWQEFVNLGYTHMSGDFVSYDYNGTLIPAIFFNEPSPLPEEDYYDYVKLTDEITEGDYEIAVVKKKLIYNNTKEVNYFGIYKN